MWTAVRCVSLLIHFSKKITKKTVNVNWLGWFMSLYWWWLSNEIESAFVQWHKKLPLLLNPTLSPSQSSKQSHNYSFSLASITLSVRVSDCPKITCESHLWWMEIWITVLTVWSHANKSIDLLLRWYECGVISKLGTEGDQSVSLSAFQCRNNNYHCAVTVIYIFSRHDLGSQSSVLLTFWSSSLSQEGSGCPSRCSSFDSSTLCSR